MSRSPAHRLLFGTAVDACSALAPDIRFDLVYLDPPFGLGTSMAARSRGGQARGRKRPESGPTAYEDGGDIGRLVAMVQSSLAAIRERMTEQATVYLHMDHRAVHEAKVAADGVFGRGAFLGEIVWAPGNGGRGSKAFSVTHQTILLYARSAEDRKRVVYQAADPMLREPYAETSMQMHFRNVDEDGRRYRERTIRGKTYRYYADQGRRLGSVWNDVPAMVANTPLCREATGYPTQKPEALLERIIRASSVPGGVVADLMCGSGTTLIVAQRLGRTFVGADQSPVAIETTRNRLRGAGVDFEYSEIHGGTPATRATVA